MTSAIPDYIVKENSLFHRRPGLAFSESQWTIVTDLDLSPADKACQYLQEKMSGPTKMMLSVTNLEWSSNLELLAKERVETKLGMFSELLDYSKKRLETFRRTISSTVRNKRGVIDGGGTVLKWLFGVATQTDLEGINEKVTGLTNRQQEIAHLLQQQATVVNESLWEVRTTTIMMGELKKQFDALKQATQEAKNESEDKMVKL